MVPASMVGLPSRRLPLRRSPLIKMCIRDSDYTADVRAIWYDRMKTICEERGVDHVDYSPYEYDPYFLYDMAHFGWTGWVQVNHDIYEFFMGKDEADEADVYKRQSENSFEKVRMTMTLS